MPAALSAVLAFFQALPDLIKIWDSLGDALSAGQKAAYLARALEIYKKQSNVHTTEEAFLAAEALHRLRYPGAPTSK